MNYPRRNGRIAGKYGDTSHSRANNITREMLENSIPGPPLVPLESGEECRELPDGRVIVGSKGQWQAQNFKRVHMTLICESEGEFYQHCIVKDDEGRFFVIVGYDVVNGAVYTHNNNPRNFLNRDFISPTHVQESVYNSGNEELIAYFEKMRKEHNEKKECKISWCDKTKNEATVLAIEFAKRFKKRFPEHFGHLKMLFSHENMDSKKRKYESWKTVSRVRNLPEGNLFFHEVFLRALLEEYPEFNKSERRRKNILEILTEE